MKTWIFLGVKKIYGDDKSVATSFRYHNGDLNLDIQHKVVKSIRDEAKKYGLAPDEIVAYPLSDEPTTHGHQRWLNPDYVLYLWTKKDGESHLGYWS